MFRKKPQPDGRVDFIRNLIDALPVASEMEPDELEIDLGNELENEMQDAAKTIPNALIDEHLRKIKDLALQADDHEAEGKRRLTLAKEARLGIAALEAANRVLQDGAPAEEGPSYNTPLKQGMPVAAGLSEAGE